MTFSAEAIVPLLTRIAEALERMAPPPRPAFDTATADAFVWHADGEWLAPVHDVSRLDLTLLKGVERQCQQLMDNTRRFVDGLPANNALLWGARGTGKSSLVKAIHGSLNAERPGCLALVEIHREDIVSLPALLQILKNGGRPTILFCDDLSFDGQDESYKSLKAVLEGGLEGRPKNVIFYATSNRRHLLSRDMIENEQSTAIHASEAVEEKVSLSDRFGLWLGFHNVNQDTFFDIVRGYCTHYGLHISDEDLQREATEWYRTRGSRSGRVAWQFFQDLAGRHSVQID
ncbi:ATP-binding protein [Insolitispirillum peregrinum]|uniref:Uncharacterized protein n=2 Tax=Insolitispirillum peregrinum TaxID=80876 RepID=A0A1N7IVE6_9PROT|nr:hypothetical protein SAMN05421779_101652 [Insolitispirillum peregrinum]